MCIRLHQSGLEHPTRQTSGRTPRPPTTSGGVSLDLQRVREDREAYEFWKKTKNREPDGRRLSRAQLLEVRRAAHEHYLQQKLWEIRHEIGCSIAIEGDEAVVRRMEGFLTVRFPAHHLFARDCISWLFV